MMSFPERLAALQPFWGTWYLDTLLGKGSYGQVYKIKKVDSLGKEYYAALKWLWIPQDSADIYSKQRQGYSLEQIADEYADSAASLREEILVMKKLSGNSHIVDCEDFDLIRRQDEPGWDILIRMELLVSLPTHFSQGMTVGDVIDLGIDICDALTTCEKAGIIHRDIKPDNIFIAPSGNYKLGDFGVAKQMEQTTTQMSRQGTPQYMAPEVYQGIAKPDHSVDIYSLGMVMHELLNRQRMPLVQLTDRIPTQSERAAAFVSRMNKVPVPPPIDGSLALKKVVCKACEFNPKKRYSSATEMKVGLVAAKSSTKLSDGLTANPVLGVGLNSGRSDFRKSSKIRKSPTQNSSAKMLGQVKPPEINEKQLDATMVLTDDMLHQVKPTRQPAKPRRKVIIALVSVLVVTTMAIWALLWINGAGKGPEPKESPIPSVKITSNQSTQNPMDENTQLQTSTVTPEPTNTLEIKDTATPTQIPTYTPTQKPTATPTTVSTATPTSRPTSTPTQAPTNTPTLKPAVTPTQFPTNTAVSTADMGYKPMSDIYDASTLERIISDEEPLTIGDSIIPWQTNDAYSYEQVLDCYSGNGCVLLKGDGLQVLIINEKEAIIALRDQNQQRYYTEPAGCSEGNGIYMWRVGFIDDKSKEYFETQLSYWATGNKVEQIDIADMQSVLWHEIDSEEDNSTSYETIADQVTSFTITDNDLIWHFTIPKEYSFSFANVKNYDCIISKSPNGFDSNDSTYYFSSFRIVQFPNDGLKTQTEVNQNTQIPTSVSTQLPTVIPTEILPTITPTQTPTASPMQTVSVQQDNESTNQAQHSATYELYHSEAPLLCYKAMQKTQMYQLSSLDGEKLITIPKETIVFSTWSGHSVIRTSYLGNVGWVSSSDFVEVDPDTEIIEFEDEVIRYFVLKQLGRLKNVQVHINDASDNTNGTCWCGRANNEISSSVRACTKYTDEYLNLDVTLSEMWSIDALTIDSSFFKNCGMSGQWKNAKSEQDPKKYFDLRMCINLSQFVLDCNVPPAVDAAILADCPDLKEIEIRRSNIDNANNLYLLSELKKLKLIFSNGNYNDAIFPESLEYLEINGDAPVWKGKTSTYSNAVNLMYLNNLQELDLSSTMITDLFPLRLLKEQGTNVYVSSSWEGSVTIVDFAPIGQPEGAIAFPSKDIEADIRSIVGIHDDDLHYSDVKDITTLDLSNRKLSDISFLKYFTGLVTLNLSGNRIKDIASLRGLTALEELDLSNNQIFNIEPLVRLSELTVLNLSDNSIQSIDVSMEHMLRLEKLDLSKNKIKALPTLPSTIIDINVSNNRIVDIKPISNLKKLIHLDITENNVKDVACLSEFDYAIQAAAYWGIGNKIHAAIAYRRAGMPMKSLEAFNLDGLISACDIYATNDTLVASVNVNGGINTFYTGTDKSAIAFSRFAEKQTNVKAINVANLRTFGKFDYSAFTITKTNDSVHYNDSTFDTQKLKHIKQVAIWSDCIFALQYDGKIEIAFEERQSNRSMPKYWAKVRSNLSILTGVVQLPNCYYYGVMPPFALRSDGVIISLGGLDPWQEMNGVVIETINTEKATDAQYIVWRQRHLYYIGTDDRFYALDGKHQLPNWNDLVAIYVDGAGVNSNFYGLTSDGKVKYSNPNAEKAVETWSDIIALSATKEIVVGLKTDGTVITTNPAFDTSDWVVFD